MNLREVKTWEHAIGHNPHEPALVEVPGAWVPAVVGLMKLAAEHPHTGLLVTNVGPRSRAAVAGIARGDLLLKYDGVQLDKASTLKRLVRRGPEGLDPSHRVAIEAIRGGKHVRFEVVRNRLGITASSLFRHLKPAQR